MIDYRKIGFLSLFFVFMQIWENYPLQASELVQISQWWFLFTSGVFLIFWFNDARDGKDVFLDIAYWFLIGVVFGTLGEYYLGLFLEQIRGTPLWVYDHAWVYTSPTSIPLWGMAGVLLYGLKLYIEGKK